MPNPPSNPHVIVPQHINGGLTSLNSSILRQSSISRKRWEGEKGEERIPQTLLELSEKKRKPSHPTMQNYSYSAARPHKSGFYTATPQTFTFVNCILASAGSTWSTSAIQKQFHPINALASTYATPFSRDSSLHKFHQKFTTNESFAWFKIIPHSFSTNYQVEGICVAFDLKSLCRKFTYHLTEMRSTTNWRPRMLSNSITANKQYKVAATIPKSSHPTEQL